MLSPASPPTASDALHSCAIEFIKCPILLCYRAASSEPRNAAGILGLTSFILLSRRVSTDFNFVLLKINTIIKHSLINYLLYFMYFMNLSRCFKTPSLYFTIVSIMFFQKFNNVRIRCQLHTLEWNGRTWPFLI